MNTCSRPCRGSTQSAVRITLGSDTPRSRRDVGTATGPRTPRRPQIGLTPDVARARTSAAVGNGGRLGVRGPARRCTGSLVRRHPRQRIERQPIADRRIAGNQEQVLRPQEPGAALPVRGPGRPSIASQRQHVADDAIEPLLEDPRKPRALFFVFSSRLQRIDVHRQPPLPPEVIPDVLVRRDAHAAGSTPRRSGKRGRRSASPRASPCP